MSKNRPLSIEQMSLLRRIDHDGTYPWMQRGAIGRTFDSLRRRGLIAADHPAATIWLLTAAGKAALAAAK